MELAPARLIAIHGSGDISLPDRLEFQTAKFDESQSLVLTATASSNFDPSSGNAFEIQNYHKTHLAYEDFILSELPRNEFFGNEVRNQLIYYPTVTREDFKTTGRLTDHMSSGELFDRIGLPQPNPSDDRFMICGGPSMLKDTCEILDRWNFEESRQGIKAGYVIERAFVE